MVQSLQGDGKAIFVFFIGVIITVVFLASFANNIFAQTNTGSETNVTVEVPATINDTLVVEGRQLLTLTDIRNATFDDLAERGLNLSTRIVNGVQTVSLTPNDTAGVFLLYGTDVNLTYGYNPDGYIDLAGARTITLLIPIFAALAILIFGLVVFIRNGSLGAFMKDFVRRGQ